MLEPLLGSSSSEQVLLFIYARGQGYAREIARFFDTDLRGIQQQLKKFEAGGVLVGRNIGRTRPYRFNPSYAFVEEIKALLKKALTFYPKELQTRLVMDRRRPRRSGKPL